MAWNFPSKTQLGAAFLMATSAIGPGFLTQTTVFTAKIGASFGFVILISILLDLGAQINIWRIVGASEKAAPLLANAVLPASGHLLTAMIVFGGLAFNIGNVAGAGMGLEVFAGIPAKWGAVLSSLLAVGLFWSKELGAALDRFAQLLGLLMISLTAWVAFNANPNLALVAQHTFAPDQVSPDIIITIVGGTVGGYISFAGAHRLLNAGISGPGNIGKVTQSAVAGIGIATLMRLMLFLAAFGVLGAGGTLDPDNPPASMFRIAAGEWGYRFCGLVIWAAAITSVVGCTFTSISFLQHALPKAVGKNGKPELVYTLFILVSVIVFVTVGKPVDVLVWAGKVNGLILPAALAIMLLAAERKSLMNGYTLPLGWKIAGWTVVAVMGGMIFV